MSQAWWSFQQGTKKKKRKATNDWRIKIFDESSSPDTMKWYIIEKKTEGNSQLTDEACFSNCRETLPNSYFLEFLTRWNDSWISSQVMICCITRTRSCFHFREARLGRKLEGTTCTNCYRAVGFFWRFPYVPSSLLEFNRKCKKERKHDCYVITRMRRKKCSEVFSSLQQRSRFWLNHQYIICSIQKPPSFFHSHNLKRPNIFHKDNPQTQWTPPQFSSNHPLLTEVEGELLTPKAKRPPPRLRTGDKNWDNHRSHHAQGIIG